MNRTNRAVRKHSIFLGTMAVLGLVVLTGAWGVESSELPQTAPDDAVMASEEECSDISAWAAGVFAAHPDSYYKGAIPLRVVRQDYSVLRFGRSVMDTPLRIGDQTFAHGLGTHANSEIEVTLPAGAVRFLAYAGIDNNDDTGGQRGSVVCAVLAGGREIFRSPVLKGGGAPLPVSVTIPRDARELVLRVETTDDGPSHDQADWAEARLELADGSVRQLDEGQWDRLLEWGEPPFSFVYDGQASSELLANWEHTAQSEEGDALTRHVARWTDPKTRLEVSAEVTTYRRYPAVEWVLYFTNKADADSPIIENILPLDVGLRTGHTRRPTLLCRNKGDHCGPESFLQVEEQIMPGSGYEFGPAGGRSSNGALPFFDVMYEEETLVTAVGWSGQWHSALRRDGGGVSRLQAGMERTHLKLHAGESIRSPRILLLLSRATPETARNQFRRLMLFHYVPQLNGKPAPTPVALQCFDRYSWSVPEWATETGQCNAANWAAETGFDSYWFDAAWFVGGFPNGVGNWYPKPDAFPNGLGPVGKACRERGLRFILWFEPERVAKNTQIALEHPEFVFGGAAGGLFKLNEPEARRWLTDLLAARIEEAGLDMYRNDFNIDPLPFWRENDAPDREGITEIRYIEGLYAMWDELRARRPGLLIDNCASGGRRIDLETCMRSIPLWRSDTNCSPGHMDWNQAQTLGLCVYVPLNTACAWTPDVYEMRSAATAGALCQWDYLNPEFPREAAKAILAESKANQRFWYGDFYPLTRQGISDDVWCAFQLHRADLDEGIVYVFRRAHSPYTGLQLPVKGLTKGREYTVETCDQPGRGASSVHSAEELLLGLEIRITDAPSSVVLRYAPRLAPHGR